MWGRNELAKGQGIYQRGSRQARRARSARISDAYLPRKKRGAQIKSNYIIRPCPAEPSEKTEQARGSCRVDCWDLAARTPDSLKDTHPNSARLVVVVAYDR